MGVLGRSIWPFLVAALALGQPARVIIDGNPDDALWQAVKPRPMAPAGGGEIRVAVRGRYLHLAARLPEPTGRVTARSIGRNPHWEEEDSLVVVAGAYPDWTVRVGPLGAYSIEHKGTAIDTDRFFAAARIGDREWTAEVAVPLNDLRAARLDEITVTAARVRAPRPGMAEQHWRWPALGPAAKLPPPQPGEEPPVFRPAWIGNSEPAIEAGRRSSLPAITSGWDDAGWRGAPAWKLRLNEPASRLPRFPTEVKLLHDGRTLAVLGRAANPVDGDRFEVYLATSGSAYVQLAITRSGTLSDAAGFHGGQRISRPRTEWESGARAQALETPGAWLARLDIPLEQAAAALGEPRIGRQWSVLFARSRPAAANDPRETSVLPVIESETMYCPARYRRLELAETSRAATEPFPREPERAPDTGVAGSSLRTMLDNHARRRAREILEAERKEWDAVETRADWERFRDSRMRALSAVIGPLPPPAPPETRVTKQYAGAGYRRLDLVYRSRPGLWVTANLYLPAIASGRRPGIVIVHSHHRPRTQAELQDMGILWARAGAAVLIMDQLGAGERLENYPWNREAYHSRYLLGMQLDLAGESLIGWMVRDILAGVDLLLARPDVDREKIILLGAVAGGGDPAAVAAALDSRIAAVAPFNFGECTPEYPRFLPDRNRWPLELADPGWGSWETTRGLRHSIAGQFFPWVICASVAPRRFVYSFEMGWNVDDLPAWKRYRKVFDLYGAGDHLDEAHGFGPFPGPGECTNIGPAQRKTLYPELLRWFGIPIPESEPDDRRPESELAALTPEVATELSMRPVHALAREIAVRRLESARRELSRLSPVQRREWLRAKWKERLGDIEPNARPEAALAWKRPILDGPGEGVILAVEPGVAVPMALLFPAQAKPRAPVVVMVSQGGKDRILAYRGTEIQALLKAGVAVCLADVRGTGESAPDTRRGPLSADVSLAATELMLGNTMLGARLKDLRTVIAYLASRPDVDARRIGIWGDSHVPPNPPRLLLDELPHWQIGPRIQRQAEPLGGLLAILAALFEDSIRAVAAHRGLASYLSLLDDNFAYLPADVVVPGLLEAGDVEDVVAALRPRPVLVDEPVDGRNRLAAGARGSDIAGWLIRQL